MKQELKKLIDDLNVDLANEYGAAIQYTYSAAVVSGLHRPALKPMFEEEVNDEMGHALYLANKIKSLGGTPTTEATKPPQVSEVQDLIAEIYKAEKDTIERYEQRKEQAEKLGLTELAVKLEDMIADETEHKEEMARLLEDSEVEVDTRKFA